MKITIQFNNVKKATKFTGILKEENIRGAKVKQLQAPPKEGELSMGEWMPLLELAITSGLAAAGVKAVFELLKGVLVENKKTESEEKIAMAQLQVVEISLEEGDKKRTLKFTKGDKAEQEALLKIVSELSNS